jgi:hypothetical protein
LNRPKVVALAGLGVAAIAALLALRHESEEQEPPPPALPVAASLAAPVADAREPSFDVVRVDSEGDSVIAGRALPGAAVVILDGGREVGTVTADIRGEWVFVPAGPLPPGARELRLKAVNPDGSAAESGEPVVLVVPERGKGPALAFKPGRAGGSKLLQAPGGGEDLGGLSLDVLDHDDGGRVVIGGKAPAGVRIAVYLDNRLLGHATADTEGNWRVAGGRRPAGDEPHTLRADQIGPKGKVQARVETPWTPAEDLDVTGTGVVVREGASLWRIARKAYGAGTSYTVIFQANRDRIRDPDRIYPGQIFSVPR